MSCISKEYTTARGKKEERRWWHKNLAKDTFSGLRLMLRRVVQSGILKVLQNPPIMIEKELYLFLEDSEVGTEIHRKIEEMFNIPPNWGELIYHKLSTHLPEYNVIFPARTNVFEDLCLKEWIMHFQADALDPDQSNIIITDKNNYARTYLKVRVGLPFNNGFDDYWGGICRELNLERKMHYVNSDFKDLKQLDYFVTLVCPGYRATAETLSEELEGDEVDIGVLLNGIEITMTMLNAQNEGAARALNTQAFTTEQYTDFLIKIMDSLVIDEGTKIVEFSIATGLKVRRKIIDFDLLCDAAAQSMRIGGKVFYYD